HDINRTMGNTTLEAYENEGDGELNEFQAEGEGEYEYEGEGEGYEYEGEGEYEAEGEYEGEGEYEASNVYAGEAEGEFEGEGEVVGEDELDELAGELLSVSSEEELNGFLGRVVGSFVQSPVGQQVGGMLRNIATQAVPVIAQALGGAPAAADGGGAP